MDLGTSVATLLIAMWPSLSTGNAWVEPRPVEFVGPPAALAPTSSVAEEASLDFGEEEEDEADDAVAETSTLSAASDVVASAELSDAELARLWSQDRAALGSISIGHPDAGRLVNGEPFPEDDPRWYVVDPPNTYATHETIAYLTAAIAQVHERHEDAPPIRINHISAKEGGYLPPHSTHQAGRDVDLGFYYPPGADKTRVRRERAIDLPRTWALLRALVTETDVELILVDHRIQQVLAEYARSIGEDRAWVDSLFFAGRSSLVHHARRHRDHFHIRFYNPRAQELGRRVQPLLGQDEAQPQLVRHMIRSGDTLGGIGRKYGVSIAALKRANRMSNDFLRAGRVLAVPVRSKECYRCAPMEPIVVPARRLPPENSIASRVRY